MISNEIKEGNNYGVAQRRIESVKTVEVLEVKLYQYEEGEDAFKGFITEFWTKDGKFLTRFETPKYINPKR